MSCSKYTAGFFHVYKEIANRDDIDLVLHLGDYIYEFGMGVFGDEDAKALNREVVPRYELNSLEDYPDTKFREQLMYLRLRSRYLYAMNSVPSKQAERFQEAVDEYYSFIDEFPDSKFRKDAEKIYKNSNNYLSVK
jgi:hypothetical protein